MGRKRLQSAAPKWRHRGSRLGRCAVPLQAWKGHDCDRRETAGADRALDQAWRGGVGVAKAVTRAQELSDPLRLDVGLEEAKRSSPITTLAAPRRHWRDSAS